MGVATEDFDPETDIIVYVKNSIANAYGSNRSSRSSTSQKLQDPARVRQVVQQNLSRRLEKYFNQQLKKQTSNGNPERLIELASRLQGKVFDKIKTLNPSHENDHAKQTLLKEEKYHMELFQAALFGALQKYLQQEKFKQMVKKLRQKKREFFLKRRHKKKIKQILEREQEIRRMSEEENKEEENSAKEAQARLRAIRLEVERLFEGRAMRYQHESYLSVLTEAEIIAAINNTENFGANVRHLMSDLYKNIGMLENMSSQEKESFRADIEAFKQNLLEIYTTMPLTEAEQKRILLKFETEILGQLDTWKENCKQYIDNTNPAEVEKLENCFSQISSGLISWARKEPILPMDAISLQKSTEILREEAETAARAAKEKESASGMESAYSLHKTREQTEAPSKAQREKVEVKPEPGKQKKRI